MDMHSHTFFEISDLILHIFLYSKLKTDYKCTKHQIRFYSVLTAEVVNKYYTCILAR